MPPPAIAAISGNSAVCAGSTTVLGNATAGGTWNSSNNNVATVDANGGVNGVTAGSVQITYSATDGNGCADTATQNLTVNALPVLAAGSNSPANIGNTLNLTAAGATSYSWAGPNSFSSLQQNPVIPAVTSAAAGTYQATGTTNGCSGTASVTVQVNAQPGGALHFNGNSFVNLGNTIQNFNAITFEAWIYRENSGNTAGFDEICSKESVNSFSVQNWDNRLHVNFANGAGWGNATVSNTPIPFNTWIHVAATRDEFGNVKIFINGQPDGTGYNTMSGASPYNRNIGHKNPVSAAEAAFNGIIEEVRVWNRALCQGELLNNRNCEPGGSQSGLLAYYNFNQGFVNANNAGVTTLTDASGNNLNGTLQNFILNGSTANWVAGYIPGSCNAFIPPVATLTSSGPTTACAGSSVPLNASAGTGYQWYRNGTLIGGATAQTYNATLAGSYQVVVTAGNCQATSNAVAVTINPLPSLPPPPPLRCAPAPVTAALPSMLPVRPPSSTARTTAPLTRQATASPTWRPALTSSK